MKTYLFNCPECGYSVEQPVSDPAPTCRHPGQQYYRTSDEALMVRDYRAEAVAMPKTRT